MFLINYKTLIVSEYEITIISGNPRTYFSLLSIGLSYHNLFIIRDTLLLTLSLYCNRSTAIGNALVQGHTASYGVSAHPGIAVASRLVSACHLAVHALPKG